MFVGMCVGWWVTLSAFMNVCADLFYIIWIFFLRLYAHVRTYVYVTCCMCMYVRMYVCLCYIFQYILCIYIHTFHCLVLSALSRTLCNLCQMVQPQRAYFHVEFSDGSALFARVTGSIPLQFGRCVCVCGGGGGSPTIGDRRFETANFDQN